MPNATAPSITSMIPTPEQIRDRLAEIARERSVLVSLLRVSRRAALAGNVGQNDARREAEHAQR